MAKLLLHGSDARQALANGVKKLAAAVEPTLGPKGLNTIIDRPIGTPIITRDGVSIAEEIELYDRFENMGAQVAREVAMKTNEIAGDGTTTSIVLANAMIQLGVEATAQGSKAVDMCKGIDKGVKKVVSHLKKAARPVENKKTLCDIANIAATEPKLGELVAEAFNRVGTDGIIAAEFGVTTQTTLEVVEGMSFDRGYLSHHMVTDTEKMQANLKKPYIILTDLKITSPDMLTKARKMAEKDGRSLLIIAEEVAPEVVVTLLEGGKPGTYLIVHPPEFGHWRKDLLEDLAILTGGKVIARDLGRKLEDITQDDLGKAERVEAGANYTTIINGGGNKDLIASRRVQVQKRLDIAPPNIEQDKLRERLAKLTGGTAVLYAGGVTPAEQKRTIQLIEDSLNAVRVAADDGVVAGGGTALAQIAPKLDDLIKKNGDNEDLARGIELVQSVLTKPLARITLNAGANSKDVTSKVIKADAGHGYNASTGAYEDLFDAGIIDPFLVTSSAIQNAASIAKLILTTETLVGDLAEDEDPTAGPALGGGSEKLGRA